MASSAPAGSAADPIRTMHPNELAKVRPPAAVENKASWPMEQRRELLKRLLDAAMEEAVPTDGLLRAFKEPITVEAFASLITMDPTPMGKLDEDFVDPKYQKPFLFDTTYQGSSSPDGDEDLKRAHRAMRIIVSDQQQVNDMIRMKPAELVAPLFRAFRCQDSKASVFHLCKCIDAILKVSGEAVLTYLTGPRMKVCLNGLLANLHCSVVVDTMFSLITIRPGMFVRPDTLKAYQKKLGQVDVVSTLLANISSKETSLALKLGSSDLLGRVLVHFDSMAVAPPNEGDIGEALLFKSLCSVECLEKLANAAASQDESYEPAVLVFSTLCKIAAKGKLSTSAPVSPVADDVDEDKAQAEANAKQQDKKNTRRKIKDFVPPPPPPVEQARLAKLGNELKPLLKSARISSLCAPVLEATEAASKVSSGSGEKYRHTSYEVSSPFGHKRFEWLRSLGYLLELDPQIPVPWKCLVAWQAQYPQNSLVQNEFSKILQTILVNSVCSDECKPAIVECKLVTHLIKRAKEYDTDHAHVLKCLNLLRLKADLLPKSHWLSQYLKSHSGWVEYLPDLRKATQVTLEPLLREELPSQQNPVVGHGFQSAEDRKRKSDFDGPAAALQSLFMNDPDNPLTALARQTSQEYAAQEKAQVVMDIDLGSRFAKSLGFTSSTPITLPESATKGVAASGESKSSSSGGGGDDKKKAGGKKKKKN